MSADHHYAVVVAGGSGTRLWPMSRTALPKQMQGLMSDETLIVETIQRLEGVLAADHILVSTTGNYAEPMKKMLPQIPDENFIVEPVARGTAAAFALFTTVIHDRDPDALIFTLASDHAITEVDKFQASVHKAFAHIEERRDRLAFIGITPTRPDTGLGYIKLRGPSETPGILLAEKFVEKPSLEVAVGYVESGEYVWNSGYYCFAAATLLKAYEEADPRLVEAARTYLTSGKIEDFEQAPEKVHEIEIIDAGRYPLVVVPADFRWSDIGNWQALHRALAEMHGSDLVHSRPELQVDVDSKNCLVYSADDRVIVSAGLDNIAIVSTSDVVFVVNMDRLDSMPEVRRALKERNLEGLL